MTITQCPQTLRVSVISAGFSSAASVPRPHPPVTGGVDCRSGETCRARKESGVADTWRFAYTSAVGQCCAVAPSPHPDEGEWHVCTVYTTCSQAKPRMRDKKKRRVHRQQADAHKNQPVHKVRLFHSHRKQLLVPLQRQIRVQTPLPVVKFSLVQTGDKAAQLMAKSMTSFRPQTHFCKHTHRGGTLLSRTASTQPSVVSHPWEVNRSQPFR